MTALTRPISVAPERLITRRGGERLQHVVQQPLHAAGEYLFFALFGVIALHHAHAAQRFGQPPGDLRGDFGARAENRANRGKRLVQE